MITTLGLLGGSAAPRVVSGATRPSVRAINRRVAFIRWSIRVEAESACGGASLRRMFIVSPLVGGRGTRVLLRRRLNRASFAIGRVRISRDRRSDDRWWRGRDAA